SPEDSSTTFAITNAATKSPWSNTSIPSTGRGAKRCSQEQGQAPRRLGASPRSGLGFSVAAEQDLGARAMRASRLYRNEDGGRGVDHEVHAVPRRNQGRVGAGAVPGRRLDVVGRRADFRAAGRWPRAGRAARTDCPSSASENAGGSHGPGPSAAAWAPMTGFGPNAMPGRAPPP